MKIFVFITLIFFSSTLGTKLERHPKQELHIHPDDKCCPTCATLDVSGSATISVASDVAQLSSTFCTKDQSAETAQTNNEIKVNAFIAKVKNLNPAVAQSSGDVSIVTEYIYNPDGTTTFLDFKACHTINTDLLMTQTNLLGTIMDFANQSGAVSQYVNWSISQITYEQNRTDVIKKAVREARAKADAAAKKLGCSIDCVKTVNINDGYTPIYSKAARAEAILPGQVDINKTVSITYVLKCSQKEKRKDYYDKVQDY